MRARISILGKDIFCKCQEAGAEGEARIPQDEQTLRQMQGWAEKYRKALSSKLPLLPQIGREIFAWLNQNGWASAWLKGPGERILEIAVENTQSPQTNALLDLPWECLHDKNFYLASDPIRPLIVFRSIDRKTEAQVSTKPPHGDLALIFMAAAPQGTPDLDYEAEESALLQATKALSAHIAVEESGCAAQLSDRLADDGPFDIVHISCHGDIPKSQGPVLVLESPEGDREDCTPGAFIHTLGQEKPSLIFLSACRTAESPGISSSSQAGESFARELIRSGVPNVLGWDGSVRDIDAQNFAQAFYEQLAHHQKVPYAAAIARHILLQEHLKDPQKGIHWHLARVYAGPLGSGACSDRKQGKRKARKNPGHAEFLDKKKGKVKVATAQEFVGRRRPAQQALRHFREGEHSGVLLFGMGNLGKSSLAARIANRMPRHKTVVVVDRYDALSIFDELMDALSGAEREPWKNSFREAIERDGNILRNALEDLLDGPFDSQPILLIIDDLEQILATPRPEQKITPMGEDPHHKKALGAVLRAFQAKRQGRSKLLLTSRYDFSLPDGKGGELSEGLARIQLRPMEARERERQWKAAEQASKKKAPKDKERAEGLVLKAINAAGGNPGLQEILCRPILHGELDAAQKAVEAIEHFRASGQVPSEESAAQEFFRRISFEVYKNALNAPQRVQLRAGTLFREGIPIALSVHNAVGKAFGIGDPEAAIQRLMGLGLMDGWGVMNGVEHAALNPLARAIAGEKLSEEDQKLLARAAMEPMAEAWRDKEGNFPLDERGVEAGRLALLGDWEAELLEKAALLAGIVLFRNLHDAKAALSILQEALSKLEAQGVTPSVVFLKWVAQCAERIGESKLELALLEKGLAIETENRIQQNVLAIRYAAMIAERGEPEKALEMLWKTSEILGGAGEFTGRAVAMGRIADIFHQQGQLDAALRIRQDVELPAFEKDGDVSNYSITMSKIADILQARGQLDEALSIRQQKLLPAANQLGDIRLYAITMGKIGDILQGQGQLDEALRIRQEEQLPIYQRLGDVSERIITLGKVADIFEARGCLDEALRIYLEECLPVAQTLHNIDIIAHIRYSCAKLRMSRKDIQAADFYLSLDELRESLDLNQKLRRPDGIAFVGKMLGAMLAGAGHIDEALSVLDQSAAAFDLLQKTDDAAQIRTFQATIRALKP